MNYLFLFNKKCYIQLVAIKFGDVNNNSDTDMKTSGLCCSRYKRGLSVFDFLEVPVV